MSTIPLVRSPAREQTLKCLDRVPALSPMTTQLLAKLARRDCEVDALTSLVEKDALLSAQILKLANSAMFGRARTVVSVHHAIAMLGMGVLRKFTLGSAISNIFARRKTAPTFSMTRFNLHSVATATLAELLCDELPVHNAEHAFVAGLLHDLGRLLLAVNLPAQFESMLSCHAVSPDVPLWTFEQEFLSIDHAELSGIKVSHWELGQPIRWAVRYHHEPDLAQDVEGVPAGKVALSLLLNKADAFVNFLNISQFPGRLGFEESPSLEFPGFTYSQERVLGRFEQEWKGLDQLFG